MTDLKNRIAAIDAFGRELAVKATEQIVAEGLLGCSPATLRRVEEIVTDTLAEAAIMLTDGIGYHVMPRDFEFTIMRGGITTAPIVVVSRYTGRVGS